MVPAPRDGAFVRLEAGAAMKLFIARIVNALFGALLSCVVWPLFLVSGVLTWMDGR